MTIKGFIHQNEDEAFLGTVSIVKDIRFYAGQYVGYMELTNGENGRVRGRRCNMYLIITDEGIVGMYDSREDAERTIWECEQADKAHGVFTEGYYSIKEI